MTLNQLRYVIEIVRCGSISTAAQELFITQPSLSKSVNELEKEMGITIFRRTNRGVVLLEEGIRYPMHDKLLNRRICWNIGIKKAKKCIIPFRFPHNIMQLL